MRYGIYAAPVVETSMRDLVLCAQTLAQCSFDERVALAARHGFRFTSILGPEHRALLAGGATPSTIRALLDEHGVGIAEVDALVDWLPGPDLPPELDGLAKLPELLDIVGALDACALNVVDLCAGPAAPVEEAASAFAAVCDRAAPFGCRVLLEFVPWTRIPDLATAVAIVALADRPNGGVMFDSWHHFRSGGTIDDLDARALARIGGLQLNDAPPSEFGARVRQVHQRRLLPGDGAVGIAALLARLDAAGCTAPVGIEVVSVELAASDPEQVAAECAARIRQLLPAR